MTAARRERKSRPLAAIRGAFLGLALAAIGLAPLPGRAATTEIIVTDRYSGLAIFGYDPVAYFTDSAPKAGRPEFEFPFGGAVWRFCNEGNRAAFVAHPEVFMPRFGGHDPMAIARGAPTPGHPLLWLIINNRLYLFFSQASLDAFVREPDHAAAAAQRRWPEVVGTLAP